MVDTEKKWFVAFVDRYEGPLDPQEIRERIENRTLESNPFIWTEGMKDWVRLNESGLKLRPIPPPLPKPAPQPRPASQEHREPDTVFLETPGFGSVRMDEGGYTEPDYAEGASGEEGVSGPEGALEQEEFPEPVLEEPPRLTSPGGMRSGSKGPLKRSSNDFISPAEEHSNPDIDPDARSESDEDFDENDSSLAPVEHESAEVPTTRKRAVRMRIWWFCILLLAAGSLFLLFLRYGA